MRVLSLVVLPALAWAQVQIPSNETETDSTVVDFVVLAGDSVQIVVEEDIRVELEKIGITVQARYLPKTELNAAVVAGDFNMLFADTYGAPYDPHSYLAGWEAETEFHHPSLTAMEPPLDIETFPELVKNVSEQMDPVVRQDMWTEILQLIHDQVLHLPLWGKRIPSVVNRKFEGYLPGYQQFDYPIQNIRIPEKSDRNVTIAPGAQSGLFESVGELDAHAYRPNEFFSNNWVYDGLVSYGANGVIEPALAASWTVEATTGGGEIIRFALRENVVFHDGAAWNCSVAKLNFDHVFAPPLREPGWHGWYNLPKYLSDWYCDDEMTFVLESETAYYPLLQELTYIRPLVMLSPLGFVNGLDTSPETDNSCRVSWGTIVSSDNSSTITCAGTVAISGTGPFKFVSRKINATTGFDDEVIFARNDDYWGGTPDIEQVTVVRYTDPAVVKEDLLNGDLDMVLGSGVLEPSDVEDIRLNYDETFEVLHTTPLQNTLAIFNAAKPPTDNIDIRKIIVHAVNKGTIIKEHLGNAEEPASELFPLTAPYCDVYLTPRFDYDYEKAVLVKTMMTYKQYLLGM